MSDTTAVPAAPASPLKKLNSLLVELKMPEGHKPVSKKVAASNYQADKQYVVPGKVASQLSAYDHEIAENPSQVRNYVTNKLIEISDCGDVKHELKALELLGKISSVNLFSETSQVTVTHTTSADLEAAIRDRIKKLLDSDVIDKTRLLTRNERARHIRRASTTA
jgi:hypothetical protein